MRNEICPLLSAPVRSCPLLSAQLNCNSQKSLKSLGQAWAIMGLITRRSQVQILAPLRPTHRQGKTPTYTVPAGLPSDFEVDQPSWTQDGGVVVTRSKDTDTARPPG